MSHLKINVHEIVKQEGSVTAALEYCEKAARQQDRGDYRCYKEAADWLREKIGLRCAVCGTSLPESHHKYTRCPACMAAGHPEPGEVLGKISKLFSWEGRPFLGDCVIAARPCGCKVIGNGTLPHPLDIEFCDQHGAVNIMRNNTDDGLEVPGEHVDTAAIAPGLEGRIGKLALELSHLANRLSTLEEERDRHHRGMDDHNNRLQVLDSRSRDARKGRDALQARLALLARHDNAHASRLIVLEEARDNHTKMISALQEAQIAQNTRLCGIVDDLTAESVHMAARLDALEAGENDE